MPRINRQPFGPTLQALMRERSISYRDLARLTQRHDPAGRGLTHAYINMMVHGHDRPSIAAMELLADSLGIPPEHFAEYRLAQGARMLDPGEVGLERALENLARLQRRVRRPAAEPGPARARRLSGGCAQPPPGSG